jgi:hypothetical protein
MGLFDSIFGGGPSKRTKRLGKMEEQALGGLRREAAGTEGEEARARLSGFDPSAAFEKFAAGEFARFLPEFQRAGMELKGGLQGRGALRSGIGLEDVNRFGRTSFQDLFDRMLGRGALQASSQDLSARTASAGIESQVGEGRKNRFLEFLGATQDRSVAQDNSRFTFGDLLLGGGQAAGTIIAGL